MSTKVSEKQSDEGPEMEGMSVVNISELKKENKLKEPKNTQPQVQPDIPAKSIYNWLAVGVSIGSLFLILGFLNRNFFYIVPLAPILSVSVWAVKRYFVKYSKYDDNIFKY